MSRKPKAKPRKRANGTGSICNKPRADGRWVATYHDLDGKRRSLYAYTRQEVADKLAAAITTLSNPPPPQLTPSTLTVRDLAQRWYDANSPGWRENTRRINALGVKHITDQFGARLVATLTRAEVNTWLVAETARGHFAAASLHKWVGVLRSAIIYGIDADLIDRNPLAGRLKLPRSTGRELPTITPALIAQMIDTTRDHRLHAAYVVTLALGLRRGEVCGLQWSDINLDTGVVTIQRQVVAGADGVKLGDLKTARSRRTLVLPPRAVTLLTAHQQRQISERWTQGDRWIESDQVFTGLTGGLLNPNTLAGAWSQCLRAAGLTVTMPIHGLRHAHATLLADAHVDPRIRQAVMGHTTIGQTERYTQAPPPRPFAVVATAMDDVLARISA